MRLQGAVDVWSLGIVNAWFIDDFTFLIVDICDHAAGAESLSQSFVDLRLQRPNLVILSCQHVILLFDVNESLSLLTCRVWLAQNALFLAFSFWLSEL